MRTYERAFFACALLWQGRRLQRKDKEAGGKNILVFLPETKIK
jgi:hypothetical protein